MSELRLEFEKSFPIPAHWIEWSESKNRYDCHVGLADSKCAEYNKMFNVWCVRQAKIDGLKDQLYRIGYVDNGGQLMKPPVGKTPDFDLLDAKQAKIDELQKRVDEFEQAIKHLSDMSNKSISYEHDLFDKGWNQCARQTVENIYRLTGIGIGE